MEDATRCGSDGIPSDVKVHVFEDEAGGVRWKLAADDGEIVADSAEGYRHKGYAIAMAQKLARNAELVDDDPME